MFRRSHCTGIIVWPLSTAVGHRLLHVRGLTLPSARIVSKPVQVTTSQQSNQCTRWYLSRFHRNWQNGLHCTSSYTQRLSHKCHTCCRSCIDNLTIVLHTCNPVTRRSTEYIISASESWQVMLTNRNFTIIALTRHIGIILASPQSIFSPSFIITLCPNHFIYRSKSNVWWSRSKTSS